MRGSIRLFTLPGLQVLITLPTELLRTLLLAANGMVSIIHSTAGTRTLLLVETAVLAGAATAAINGGL